MSIFLISKIRLNKTMFIKHFTSKKRVMPRRGYRSLTIPEGLYNELKKYFDKSNDTYVTMSEVVREALREYLKNHS